MSGASTFIFEQGTIIAEGFDDEFVKTLDGMIFDERTGQWRAEAISYREIILACQKNEIEIADLARNYQKIPCQLTKKITPRSHQQKALRAWMESGQRGVIQLPTGSGKTILAILAMSLTCRPTLIIVPTIDLLHQWYEVLKNHFDFDVGILGGGSKEIHDVTVSTYDSAAMFVERIGNQFGLLIVDECHHLPAPQYKMIALSSIAPFRIGLSATVERTDGKESEIFDLLGPLVYEGRINEMQQNVLSPYDVINIQVPLTEEEREQYTEARSEYTSFIKRHRISFAGPNGWLEFVKKAAMFPGGKKAMKAYRRQKKLAQASSAKLTELWKIINNHNKERIIVFTDDNSLAYRIGQRFVLPVITHKTKLSERKKFLQAFRDGELSILVTSRVLNEGVDVPEASVGVVVSGSGTVREHVQRLGRILRHQPGKRAKLYEIISKGTSELYVNKRRKQHHAYQKST